MKKIKQQVSIYNNKYSLQNKKDFFPIEFYVYRWNVFEKKDLFYKKRNYKRKKEDKNECIDFDKMYFCGRRVS